MKEQSIISAYDNIDSAIDIIEDAIQTLVYDLRNDGRNVRLKQFGAQWQVLVRSYSGWTLVGTWTIEEHEVLI
jgi:hypothetical protein